MTPSPITIEQADATRAAIAAYAGVSCAFTVDRVVDVTSRGGSADGFILSERRLAVPYQKDYDTLDGDGPLTWPLRFDLSRWAIFTAWCGATRVGGASVAFDTPGLAMLEGRRDLAVLWDIRVAPEQRGRSGGSALFARAAAWARDRGCRELKVETQNTNVAACRFYARQGCQLRAIVRAAYPDLPEEIQLLWYRELEG